MKFRQPLRTQRTTTHLPPHLSQYVDGLAEIKNQSISSILVEIVNEHFERAQKKPKEKKNAKDGG